MPRTVIMPVVGIDGVFDHRDLALLRTLPAGNGGGHLRAVLRHGLAQIDQHTLGNREGDVDRRHLVDDRKRRGVGRTHEVADLDVGGADPARERRAEKGVALLNLQIVEHGLIGLDRRIEDIGLGLGVIDIDLRGRALGDEIGVAAQVALRAFELGLVLGERALGLLDLRIDLPRVEREQEVALVHPGAVLEMHGDDGGLQPRLQRDAGDRRHHADGVDIDGNRLALGLGNFHSYDAGTLRRLGAGIAAHP